MFSKRARSRKRRILPRDTSKFKLCRTLTTGGQGVRREAESEGFAENRRAVAEAERPWRTGRPKVGQGRARSMGAKASLIHPPYQGVCGRHGGEDQCVTPGGLVWFPIGNRDKRPYKVKRNGERRQARNRTVE